MRLDLRSQRLGIKTLAVIHHPNHALPVLFPYLYPRIRDAGMLNDIE
jgi:hypothetical protein